MTDKPTVTPLTELPCGFEFRGSHGPYHCHKRKAAHMTSALGHEFVPWERRHRGFGRRALDAARTDSLDGLRALSDAATNKGRWRVRNGFPADSFMPDGYRWVEFGLSEKQAAGRGTDQLAPEDAAFIVAAVNYVRAALDKEPKP